MASPSHNSYRKIVNPNLARGALHCVHPHGEFKAYVKLAKPEQIPSYMEYIKLESPGLFEVHLPCANMSFVEEDENIISIELIERISSCSKPI